MNNSMTGNIILSRDDSAAIRRKLLNMNEEYIRERSEYFKGLSSSMIIHTAGTDSTVEFEDLDLSALDAIIDGETNESAKEFAVKTIRYTSISVGITFVGLNRGVPSLRNPLFTTKDNYVCKKVSTEIQGCNLTEAA